MIVCRGVCLAVTMSNISQRSFIPQQGRGQLEIEQITRMMRFMR